MHREYIRIVEGAEIAVLFIHGIVGTPNHFNAFIPKVPENMSIYNMLLDGHGKGVSDFSHTSMKKWEAQIKAITEQLSQDHREIYIVAHSLGTLLAIGQALENPKITRLFLLAVPLNITFKYPALRSVIKVYFGNIKPDDKWALAARDAYGIGLDKNLFKYLGWIPRYLELFRKSRQTRPLTDSLEIPCRVYQSDLDELVSLRSLRYLENRPEITLTRLKNSGHYYYDPEDLAFLVQEFDAFLAE